MPWQTQGELFPAQEQEEQLGQQVEEPQENGQKIKEEPQAELPEAQSAIMDVKNMNKEDMGRNQEENLHQQRGDQQNQVSEKVAGISLMKHPLACFLENMKEQLNAELQIADTRIKTRQKRLEEEMKIIREKLNCFPHSLQKQVQVLASDRAACEDFQQMSGNEGPQVKNEAQEQCPPEVLQVQHIKGSESAAAAALPGRSHSVKPGTSSLGSSFISPKQETEKRYLEMLGKMVNQENPVMKYTEKERIGSGYLLGEELWLVMEFMDGGTLSDVITKTCLSEDHMAAICREPECRQLQFWHRTWGPEGFQIRVIVDLSVSPDPMDEAD
ncbi:uncharacterized protein LOC134432561 [Melospiza melodia melodia]|uniref:uncharacterized protein LOC134432561 n=1 Tax=Melospiza melodia melodia TaxID=1914991 RepID=UPI002FD19C89